MMYYVMLFYIILYYIILCDFHFWKNSMLTMDQSQTITGVR